MKKAVVLLLCMVLAFGAAGCSGNSGQTGESSVRQGKKVYKTLDPEKVLTAENVAAVVDYEPVLEKSKAGKFATALYRSEPIGAGDVVQVDVCQPAGKRTAEDVEALFLEAQDKRSDAVKLPDLETEAFIAFPSVHILQNSYYIKITAGSGADDAQKALLEKLAGVAVANVKEIIQ